MFGSLAKFLAGSAVGATVGATIGLLMAPKSGAELQAETSSYISNMKAEGEKAREEAEAQVAERFRQRVNDPSAFSS